MDAPTLNGIDVPDKNVAADAEAICEAVSRPSMRFVPIKSIEQQAVLSIHRLRQGFVEARTAQADQIRRIARIGFSHFLERQARGELDAPFGCRSERGQTFTSGGCIPSSIYGNFTT